MKMDYINILHLSDLHFGIEKNVEEGAIISRREVTLESLLNTLKNLDKHWKPNIIAVSGDIGYKGIKSEYDEASKWFERLLVALNLEPDRLIICAGNHDRFRYEKNPSVLPNTIGDADERLAEINFKKNSIPFSDFIEFQKTLKIPPLIYKKIANYLVGTREILDLKFLILNSAWFAWGGKRDSNKMIMGKSQLIEMKNECQIISRTEFIPDQMTIAVLHHPPEDLDPCEIDTIEGREPSYPILAECSDLILCGHKHGERFFAPDKKFAKSWLFKTGASYEGEEYKNNCEILHVDPKSLSAGRLKIYYQPDKNKWVENVDEEGYYLFYTSLSRLRINTQEILAKIHNKIGSDCNVNRITYLNSIEQNLQEYKIIFILGDPTVGKSALMKDVANKISEEYEVIAFNISYFNHNSLSDYLKDYNIVDDLRDIINSIKKEKICIFIDQCERILEDEIKKLNLFKDLFVKLQEINLEKKELKLILTCRTDAFQKVYSELIHSYDCEEIKISAVIINNFSDEELSQVFSKIPNLELIYNQVHLKALIKNPKMLDILTIREFEIFPKTKSGELKNIIITETYFMDQFWKQIVRNNEKNAYNTVSPESRAQLLNKISIDSFKKAEPYKISSVIDFNVLKTLISDNILIRYKDQIFFSHDVYEEWSLLDFIRNKSNIKDNFLIPYNSYKRNSRAFQLFSRYILEVDNDYKTWISLYSELEDNNDVNPNWIQELILGILKSEILLNHLKNLKIFLIDKNSSRFNQLLKILQLKCITFEGEIAFPKDFSYFSSKPIYPVWSIVIDFILMNFHELGDENLYECSEIIRIFLNNSNPQVNKYIDKILVNYEEIANNTILNDEIQFNLDYEKKKKLKKNVIYGIIKCKALKQDNNLTIIDNLRSSTNSKRLFKDVIFDIYGWVPLYFSFPDYTINILKDLFIRDEKREKIIPTPFSHHDFHFSFDEHPSFTETSFKVMLEQNQECGLTFIHKIINHAMDLWKKIEEPVVHGPGLRRISYDRTPIPQFMKIGGKEIEVWGDEIVYKWILHLGPTIVKYALQALEEWIIKQIQVNKENSAELIYKILSDTNSFAVVSVCSQSVLNIFFSEKIDDTNTLENLIKALIPILEKPIFWILQGIFSSEKYIYYRDVNRNSFEKVLAYLLFFYTNLNIIDKITKLIESFPNNIPFIFEQEKTDSLIVLERKESTDLLVAKTKKENYKPFKVGDFISMVFKAPEDLYDKDEMEYHEGFLKLQSFKGTVFNALDNGGVIKNYSIEGLYQFLENYLKVYDFFSDRQRFETYFEKLKTFLETESVILQEIRIKDLPEELQQDFGYLKFLQNSNDILELITGFFTLLINFKWGFVESNKLEEKCKEVILKTLEYKLNKDVYSAYNKNLMGIHQSAAKSLPRLLYLYPNNKSIKRAIKLLSISPNHQVRDIIFTYLRDLWTTNSNFIWKLIKKLRKLSITRAIIMNPEFIVINKYRDPRITRSQFVDITGRYIKKLYVKRILRLFKNRLSKKRFMNLTPIDLDLKLYRSSLKIIPFNEVLNKIQPSKNFIGFLKDLFYFTIYNDLQYKKDGNNYSRMQTYYGDCRNHFYREWIRESVEIITYGIFHLDNKNLTNEFLTFIISNWSKTEKFFEIFLEELIIAGNQSEFENKLIDIWCMISESIFNTLKQEKIIKYCIISLLFFRRPFYSTLQNQFQNPNSLKRIGEIMRIFLEVKLFPDIIWLMNQIQNFELTKSLLGTISVKIKNIIYKEDKVKVLRNNTSILLNNYWKKFRWEIIYDENLHMSFKYLVDKMVEWNSPLASKLQDDMKL
ncbi:hypothetical protein LCGC14_0606900 [marine sediment metagenome]|uniref:Uncharacterized protein n=1 Tax=marine sediment metagenome TaxID=412755 RepID=A0A0F9TV51_9ZZZZ